MRSFWYEYLGDRIEIIFSLVKNGRLWHHYKTGEKLGVEFDYPCPQHGDEIAISIVDLEEMDSEVRSMLFQSLKMDAPEFGLSYS
jgi:hypothetical protein